MVTKAKNRLRIADVDTLNVDFPFADTEEEKIFYYARIQYQISSSYLKYEVKYKEAWGESKKEHYKKLMDAELKKIDRQRFSDISNIEKLNGIFLDVQFDLRRSQNISDAFLVSLFMRGHRDSLIIDMLEKRDLVEQDWRSDDYNLTVPDDFLAKEESNRKFNKILEKSEMSALIINEINELAHKAFFVEVSDAEVTIYNEDDKVIKRIKYKAFKYPNLNSNQVEILSKYIKSKVKLNYKLVNYNTSLELIDDEMKESW